MKKNSISLTLFLIAALLLIACEAIEDVVDEVVDTVEDLTEGDDWDEGEDWDDDQDEEDQDEDEHTSSAEEYPTLEPLPESAITDKWSLWSSGRTMLRGANIWQAVVIPELDGLEFKGSGPVGPPYSQEDFNQLAALGANYVTISGPGLFTEKPPYTVDQDVLAYTDELLQKIANANMFAAIGFRTGPGRSEFGLCCGGDSYFDGYFNDIVWEDQAAQDAWVEMWRFTAEHYRDNPIVVGYKLMVEPNSEAIFFRYYEPDEFYPEYAGTLYDWNQFYPRLVSSIREVDQETPILVNGAGFSAIRWMPYLQVVDEPRIVYIAHQYEPFDDYTHQEPSGSNAYPGQFDLNWDGDPDDFNRAWLAGLLSPLREFISSHGVPLGVDEFGVNRWVPGADAYMNDIMGLFEEMGINYSLWEWQTTWPDFEQDVDDMNYRFGPDADNFTNTDNDLLDVIKRYWSLNTVRPWE